MFFKTLQLMLTYTVLKMLDEPVTGSFKALTVPDFNKTSMGICVDVWSIFYPLSAKAWVRGSVLFLCSWCHNSPSRPARNAGNAALCSDSGPGLSWTIKSLSFNLSKKVNYFTVNKQIGSTWEYFLCQKTPFQSWKHYNTYHVMTEFVHTDLSVFCSPAAAPVQPCRINLHCAGGKREKKKSFKYSSYQNKRSFCWTGPKVDCAHYQRIMSNRGCLGRRVRTSFQQSEI